MSKEGPLVRPGRGATLVVLLLTLVVVGLLLTSPARACIGI